MFRVIRSCGMFLVLVSGKAIFLPAAESKCKLQYFKNFKYLYSMVEIRILCKENMIDLLPVNKIVGCFDPRTKNSYPVSVYNIAVHSLIM